MIKKDLAQDLVIDCQLFQTTAWDRGMGKYCFNLLQSLYGEYPNIHLVFNKNLKLDPEIVRTIKSSMPEANLSELDLACHSEVAEGRKRNQKILDRYLLSIDKTENCHFLILSNFTFDYVATLPSRGTTGIIAYDLIPLLNWDSFKHMFQEEVYFEHFKDIVKADVVYTISETVKNDIIEYLGVSPQKVISINGASIPRKVANLNQISESPPKKLAKRRFFLFVSADFPHKNNKRLIEAFSKFNFIFGGQFELLITSTFSEESQLYLGSLSKDVKFVGSITDSNFQDLLEAAEAVILVSKSEGLGLPLLEAVEAGKPVICSDIPSHKEISSDAFYFCDPNQKDSIYNALLKATTKTSWVVKEKAYQEIKQRMTWQKSASIFKKHTQRVLNRAPQDRSDRPAKISIFIDPPRNTKESLSLQKSIMKIQSKFDIELYQTGPSHLLYTPYLISSKSLKNYSSGQKSMHIISNIDSTLALSIAILYGGIIIFNTSFKKAVSSLARSEFAKSEYPNINHKDLTDIIIKDLVTSQTELLSTVRSYPEWGIKKIDNSEFYKLNSFL